MPDLPLSVSTLFDLWQPLLRRLDPETAHSVAMHALKFSRPLWRRRGDVTQDVSVDCLGLSFKNPLGLAAGCDKNGDFLDALGAVGFGFIEIGTVTPRPQFGSPRPRLFMIPTELALINRMGFNNKGIDHVVENLRRKTFSGICGVNIGKNADTANDRAQDDYLACFRKVFPYADYVTINLSSPNTPRLRELQTGEGIDQVAGALLEERIRLRTKVGREVPLLVKIGPDLSAEDVREISVSVRKLGLDGVVAANTTIELEPVAHLAPPGASGGLSGRPMLSRSLATIRELRKNLGAAVPIIGAGGITTGAAAIEMMHAGADLLQIYTGFVYLGPALIADVLNQLGNARAPSNRLARARER